MKTSTAHSRLESLQLAAEECLTRDEAQKILRKADKAHAKLESSAAPSTAPRTDRHLKPAADEDINPLTHELECVHPLQRPSSQRRMAKLPLLGP